MVTFANDGPSAPHGSDLTRRLIDEVEALTRLSPNSEEYPTHKEEQAINRMVADYENLDPTLRKELADLATLMVGAQGQAIRAAICRPGRVVVDVSEKGMAATIEVFPPEGGGKPLNTADVVVAIREAKVVFGADLAAINAVVNEAARSSKSSVKGLIACGKAPINGEAGRIECCARELIACGSSSHRRQWMTKKEEVLLRIIPPTPGVDGVDVFGGTIPAVLGREATIEVGENVVLDAAEHVYRSTVDGLAVFDDKGILVRRQLIWSGDLTINDPPLQFDGSVTVRGTVRDGARLSATDDIEILEGVEGASVISLSGSVIIKQGIAGRGRSYVSAKKLVDANYIENGAVYCEGAVIARHAILHSRVVAGGSVCVQFGKGAIFGGDIRAGELIKAKSFGNIAGVVTKVSVGHDWAHLEKLQASEAVLAGIRQQAAACEELIGRFRHAKPQLSQLSDQERQAFCSLLKRHVAVSARLQSELKLYAEVDSAWHLSRGGEIVCLENLYAGTIVKMGDATSMTSSNFNTCQLQLLSEEKRIVAVSPSGRKRYLV